MKLNLGCPWNCEGYLCVDLFPRAPGVIKEEAIKFLKLEPYEPWDEIRTENLLEHLPNVHGFLELCFDKLRYGGKLIVVTDNAEWLLFYLPFDLKRVGVGAHSMPSYSLRFNAVHLSIFTKMHLREHLLLAGFQEVKVRRIWRVAGARIEGVGVKR
jgi:hypothetical protein